ncbi:16S rRNA (guanine(527)-N(7))-methyltransferase RsmG [Deinococcus yavapaiensis]|uniref:16S rRNA (guanine(527)-N(7))-methyltransferase RsmG n=1 Tax=Deinococcus yavapaiensis TaxID=309889 RepID=UPI001FE45D4F|nr:16S rRNA (guanine(527)-N(7))-methyltransferase RsmG [Deinococcus yavapaiensis]
MNDRIDAFATFLDLLVEASGRMSLTTIRDESGIVAKHFVDSLSCLRSEVLNSSMSVIDLGTGAGFPGLPLAIACPHLDVHLLDATRRKIEFVGSVIEALELPNAHPHVGRAETLGRQEGQRGRYDRVVTRAVSTLATLVELSLPLLRDGGVLIAQKGPSVVDELEAGRKAAKLVGGEVEQVIEFRLPITGETRSLVLVRKTRSTPAAYPRREGVPHRSPLF